MFLKDLSVKHVDSSCHRQLRLWTWHKPGGAWEEQFSTERFFKKFFDQIGLWPCLSLYWLFPLCNIHFFVKPTDFILNFDVFFILLIYIYFISLLKFFIYLSMSFSYYPFLTYLSYLLQNFYLLAMRSLGLGKGSGNRVFCSSVWR